MNNNNDTLKHQYKTAKETLTTLEQKYVEANRKAYSPSPEAINNAKAAKKEYEDALIALELLERKIETKIEKELEEEPHTITVGTIYQEINKNYCFTFHEVIKTTPKTITLIEIEKIYLKKITPKTYAVIPNPGQYVTAAKPITRKANITTKEIKINNYHKTYAITWHGTPETDRECFHKNNKK